jgi:hypothetical protein
MNFHHVFRWCQSIRLDPVFLKNAARTVVYISTFCLVVPLPMTVYAVAIIFNWEQKNQAATEAFVVVQTVVSYLGLFAVVWGIVGLQWLGMLELYNGVER